MINLHLGYSLNNTSLPSKNHLKPITTNYFDYPKLNIRIQYRDSLMIMDSAAEISYFSVMMWIDNADIIIIVNMSCAKSKLGDVI